MAYLMDGSKWLWFIAIALFTMSAIVVFSANAQRAYHASGYYLADYERHVSFMLAGGIVMLIAARFPRFWVWRKSWYLFGPVTVGLLVYLLVYGIVYGKTGGAVRDMRIGPVNVQPIEIAKFVIILFLSDRLTLYQEDSRMSWRRYGLWWAAILIPVSLIFIQNQSTAIIMLIVSFLMMFMGRVPAKYLLGTAGIGLAVVALVLPLVMSGALDKFGRLGTMRERIEDAVAEMADSDEREYAFTDDNRQGTECRVAVANGAVPCGPGNSLRREKMQAPQHDCVFAVAVEEWGWLAVGTLIGLYMFLLVAVGRVVYKCDRPYPMLLATGLAILIVLQAFVNMCVGVNLFITGQPLPLVSVGGWDFLMSSLYFGICINISRYVEHGASVPATAGENTPETRKEA